MNLEFGNDPAGWICHGGAPARAARNMPSYETEDGQLQVWDLLVPKVFGEGQLMLFSRFYGTASALAPEGPCPLHHSPDAWWAWRPVVWKKMMFCWTRLGSQQELAWRYGLEQMMWLRYALEAGDEENLEEIAARFTMPAADAKAQEILSGELSPFQRLELAADGEFRVIGARTGNLYSIEPGNGFRLIDRATHETVVSYCLHPEYWMPHDDVALSTKLALEDPDLEIECLENAKPTFRPSRDRATPALRQAAKLEAELLDDRDRQIVVA